MRDIKFRGKRLDNGEWVYGDLLQTEIMEIFKDGLLIKVAPETVGQWVHSLQCYIGDIIDVPYGYWEKDTDPNHDESSNRVTVGCINHVVQYESCNWARTHGDYTIKPLMTEKKYKAFYRQLKSLKHEIFLLTHGYRLPEVVGNIFDNPSLIKE